MEHVLSSTQQQLDELECMLSMFPDTQELQVDSVAKQQLEEFVTQGHGQRPDRRMQYTLFYKDLAFGRQVPVLTLTCPLGYPEDEPMTFEVQCPQLSRVEMETLQSELLELTTSACAAQEVVGLQLYQQMHEFLSQVQRNKGSSEVQSEEVDKDVPTKAVLGRRAIYFHHIIASNKRRVVKEWALELQLGGFSKIGWPGVVIVEGEETNVQEYVRRLQHLRWKQITVRGEQTEETDNVCLDAMRRLPCSFQEFPENGMSEVAAACRAAGLEDLFLTIMKIYGR
ncbi:RWD domain-containing protein 2B [Phytophthora boehmeriae]|uniref:RWD domain-containing protein 2B n=1 Tax=Phytophthora boehmeriae TaxID=109152 RepID=A0A8T1XDU4_9STRA|nr:RWD domain-containing protein 2B [Phytophthora boehmeriae]